MLSSFAPTGYRSPAGRDHAVGRFGPHRFTFSLRVRVSGPGRRAVLPGLRRPAGGGKLLKHGILIIVGHVTHSDPTQAEVERVELRVGAGKQIRWEGLDRQQDTVTYPA